MPKSVTLPYTNNEKPKTKIKKIILFTMESIGIKYNELNLTK